MSDQLIVATRKGVFSIERTNSGGSTRWKIARSSFVGDNATLVLADPRDGTHYAALDHGHFGVKLHRSIDKGKTWEPCGVPIYPEPPEGAPEDCNPMSNLPTPWSLKLIWSLEPGGSDEPGVLWCGTVPGGLFRSTDGGMSWSMVRSLWDDPLRKDWFGGGLDFPGIHSICVDPRNSQRVTVGVSCGGVWLTEDGGTTWACRAEGMWAAYMPPDRKFEPQIQDPHRVVHCAADPDMLWAQHHNGVFRSTDGAKSWHEITAATPSTFGFAVAVHPSDADTAWLVPAIKDEKRVPVDGKVVVSRTRDGGKTFEILRDGLPQEHSYDLVFRHALDVSSDGTRLAMGSTTGSLWISENQGDGWELVSSHLPPIHCVHFA